MNGHHDNVCCPFPSFSYISRVFAPGWFAAVMGTGMLVLTAHSLSGRWQWLAPIVQPLHWLNVQLFCVLAVPWFTRWQRIRDAAVGTLKHPMQACFYPTFAIATLVLAMQWLAVAGQAIVAFIFWWGGTLLALILSFAVLFYMLIGEQVRLEHVTPAKFIPAVGPIVVPVTGGPLLELQPCGVYELALLVNLLSLGAGAMMYLGLFSLTLQRKLLVKPTGVLTPTTWIHLSPLGITQINLLNVLGEIFQVNH